MFSPLYVYCHMVSVPAWSVEAWDTLGNRVSIPASMWERWSWNCSVFTQTCPAFAFVPGKNRQFHLCHERGNEWRSKTQLVFILFTFSLLQRLPLCTQKAQINYHTLPAGLICLLSVHRWPHPCCHTPVDEGKWLVKRISFIWRTGLGCVLEIMNSVMRRWLHLNGWWGTLCFWLLQKPIRGKNKWYNTWAMNIHDKHRICYHGFNTIIYFLTEYGAKSTGAEEISQKYEW